MLGARSRATARDRPYYTRCIGSRGEGISTARATARDRPYYTRISLPNPYREVAPVLGWGEQPLALSLSWCAWEEKNILPLGYAVDLKPSLKEKLR